MCDNTCLPESKRCNGKIDCYDGSDEENCNGTSKVYQVGYLFPYKRTLNSSSFLVFWYMQGGDNKTFEYLPSISKAGNNKWANHTTWIEHTEFRFTNLTAFTTYNITVYVRIKGSQHVDTPYLSINVTTAEGMPKEPMNVNVTQLNGSRVIVSWDAPTEVFGILKEYTVYYGIQSPTVNPVNSVKVSPADRSIVLESNFEANSTYNFWVSYDFLTTYFPSQFTSNPIFCFRFEHAILKMNHRHHPLFDFHLMMFPALIVFLDYKQPISEKTS